MRTATPLVTWSRITEWGPSATFEASSMPRLMGPGCMTSTFFGKPGKFFKVEAETLAVFADRREGPARLALELEPEQHHHVGAVERLVEIVGHRHAQAFGVLGQQRGRAAQDDLHAHGLHAPGVRPRHARVEDIADDRHFEPFEPAEFLPDGHHVKQRLGRVFVQPVARVDDHRVGALGEKIRHAGRAVAHDDHVDFHGLDVAYGVAQGFAFVTELVDTEKLSGVAESRFSASSKEMRVRVLLS